MANITLLGASYTDVPAVDLPQTGGGTVRFYENGGSSGYTRTVIAPQQTVTPTSNGTYYSATLNVSEGFEADAEYIITYNGTEYFFTCQVMWGTNYLLGDINYFYGGSDLPYPFGIIWTSGTTCTLARNNGNQVTVKIEKLELTGSSGGGSSTLITKTITANGTYSASDDSADGYSSVTVNVPSSAASSWTKVAETSYQVSTTSTYNVILRTGNTDIWTSDKLLYIRIRDTAGPRSGYFYGSDNFVPNFKALSGSETATTNILKNCYKYSSGAYSTFSNSYGGRVTNVDSSGDITIPFRYSSSYSGTINGTYSIQVYLLDMPSGITIFE